MIVLNLWRSTAGSRRRVCFWHFKITNDVDLNSDERKKVILKNNSRPDNYLNWKIISKVWSLLDVYLFVCFFYFSLFLAFCGINFSCLEFSLFFFLAEFGGNIFEIALIASIVKIYFNFFDRNPIRWFSLASAETCCICFISWEKWIFSSPFFLIVNQFSSIL